MATYFSDWYGADGVDDTSLPANPKILASAVKGGMVQFYRAEATVSDMAAADDIRLMTLKRTDRLWALYLQTDGGFDVSNSVELGIWTPGDAHDGAMIDVDLFGAAHDLTSALDVLTEVFTSGAAGGEDRGKQLWEIAATGAPSYTEEADAPLEFDIAIDGVGNDTTAGTVVLIALVSSDT